MSERIALQPAYILHQRPYRETSLLVEAFSQDFGRVALVARGARGARGRWPGVLQSFRPLLLSWSGRGDLFTLAGAESGGAGEWLDGQALFSGFYLNELLLRLLHRHDPHPGLFAAYRETLQQLRAAADAAPQVETVLRRFELQLLEALGYGLLLAHEADTGLPVQAQSVYCYEPERGFCSMPSGRQGALNVRGATLLALAGGDLADPDCRREAKRLMRAVLQAHLGDKPLRSRELLRGGTGQPPEPLIEGT